MSATVKSKEKRNHCSLSSEKRVRSLRCSINLTKNNNEFNNQLILRHYLCYENSLAIHEDPHRVFFGSPHEAIVATDATLIKLNVSKSN